MTELGQGEENEDPAGIDQGKAEGLGPGEPPRRVHQAELPEKRVERHGKDHGGGRQPPEEELPEEFRGGAGEEVGEEGLRQVEEPEEQAMHGNRRRAAAENFCPAWECEEQLRAWVHGGGLNGVGNLLTAFWSGASSWLALIFTRF